MEKIFDLEKAEKVPYDLGILKRAQIENGAEFNSRKMANVKTENPRKIHRLAVRRSCIKNKQNMIEACYHANDFEIDEDFNAEEIEKTLQEAYDKAYAEFCTEAE